MQTEVLYSTSHNNILQYLKHIMCNCIAFVLFFFRFTTLQIGSNAAGSTSISCCPLLHCIAHQRTGEARPFSCPLTSHYSMLLWPVSPPRTHAHIHTHARMGHVTPTLALVLPLSCESRPTSLSGLPPSVSAATLPDMEVTCDCKNGRRAWEECLFKQSI